MIIDCNHGRVQKIGHHAECLDCEEQLLLVRKYVKVWCEICQQEHNGFKHITRTKQKR